MFGFCDKSGDFFYGNSMTVEMNRNNVRIVIQMVSDNIDYRPVVVYNVAIEWSTLYRMIRDVWLAIMKYFYFETWHRNLCRWGLLGPFRLPFPRRGFLVWKRFSSEIPFWVVSVLGKISIEVSLPAALFYLLCSLNGVSMGTKYAQN